MNDKELTIANNYEVHTTSGSITSLFVCVCVYMPNSKPIIYILQEGN